MKSYQTSSTSAPSRPASSSSSSSSNEQDSLLPTSANTTSTSTRKRHDGTSSSSWWWSIAYPVSLVISGILVGATIVGMVNYHHGHLRQKNRYKTTDPTTQFHYDPVAPSTAESSVEEVPEASGGEGGNQQEDPGGSAASKYKKFQPLGFQIFTGGAPAFINSNKKKREEVEGSSGNFTTTTNMVPNPECKHLNSYGHVDGGNVQCYMGLVDQEADVHRRLQVMEKAVQRAHELSDDSDDTLKIFIAPEFFFRGKNGAYVFDDENESENSCSEVCQIMRGLERIVAQAKYKDWLFLFGTVIVSEVLPTEDEYDYLFYNFAPMYKGFDPTSSVEHHGKRYIVPKRYVSNIDFLTPRRHFNDSLAKELLQTVGPEFDETASNSNSSNADISNVVMNPFNRNQKMYDRRMWHTYKDELNTLGYTMIEYDWFVLDNVTFTVEVCLDHDMGTALNTYLADAVCGSRAQIPSFDSDEGHIKYIPIPKHQAQISLVSSSGMSVNPSSMALVNDGTIILQDGESEDDPVMSWEDECQQYSWHFRGGSESVRRRGIVSSTEVVFEYDVDSSYHKRSIYGSNDWQTAIEGVFTKHQYEPMITVYQSTAIAQVPS